MIEAPAISPQLLEQTRKRIEGDLAKLAMLARTEVSTSRFYGELLRRVVSALAALDGTVWSADREQGIKICHQLADQNPAAASKRQAMMLNVLRENRASIQTIAMTDEAGEFDDTDNCAIVLAVPIPGRQGAIGVLEIQQRARTPRATQQGNLRFCERAAAVAADFEHSKRVAVLEATQQTTQQASEFIAAVHANLSVKETATRIANEGRRLCEVDRVTVLIRHGNRYQVEAVSGAEGINQRSEAIANLRRLAERTAKTGQTLVWDKSAAQSHGTKSKSQSELASYAAKTSVERLVIIPLDGKSTEASKRAGANSKERKGNSSLAKPGGIAILEQLEACTQRERLEVRVSVVREHGGRALSNANQHENSILLPWRRGKAGSAGASRARILPRWLLFLLCVSGVVSLMILTPADFTLEARGTLEPTTRRNVFATADGVVQRVHVRHGQQVAGGEPLAELVNVDLDVELAAKQGELATTIERQAAVRSALLNSSQLHASERDKLTGEAEQLRRAKESLQRQLKILDRKLAQNIIVSPISGEVMTWDVEELLSHRRVRPGQKLMSVADPAGEWELELQLPENRLGHLLEAQRQAADKDVVVEFILATEPGVTYQGRIKEIHRRAEIAGPEGNAVLVKVAVKRDDLEQLHPGASVVAKFHCGERSLGYVLFRDVVEFAQRRVLFRF